MDSRSPSDSRHRHSSPSVLNRASLWNPAVSLVSSEQCARVTGPPAAHQQRQQPVGHLSRHQAAPPPAHRQSDSRGYRTPGVLVMSKCEAQQFPIVSPPHIYSTIGAYGPVANGNGLTVPSKPNFTIVDTLISKSPSPSRESRSRTSVVREAGDRQQGAGVSAAGLAPGQWSPHSPLPHFPTIIPTTSSHMQPYPLLPPPPHEQEKTSRRVKEPMGRVSMYAHPAAVAEVTFAHMFPDQQSFAHVPHTTHFSSLTHQHSSLPQSPVSMFTPSHVSLRTSHPPLAPHLLHHNPPPNQRTLVPSHQYLTQPSLTSSASCDISRSAAACDNNNCSASGVIVKCEPSRPESHPPVDLPDIRRRDVNENSSEVPCSSVSPTNSTASSSNSGGSNNNKFLPKKKMWLHMYTVTKQDSPETDVHLAADKVTGSPDDLVRENGLIHSNDNNSSSSSTGSTSNSQRHNSSSHSATYSNGDAGAAAAAAGSSSGLQSKDGKEKVNGASKKKPVPGNKKLKVQDAAAATTAHDSEATASGSESDHQAAGQQTGQRVAKGQKRASVARDKKAKKTKGDTITTTATCDQPQSQSANSATGDKKKESSCEQGHEVNQKNEDSERTEDEADEKQEKWSPGVSSSPSSREAAKHQKRGRRPKTAAASGESDASSNCVSNKEKSKGKSEKSKKSKASALCDRWIDRSGLPFLQNKSCSELSSKSSLLLPKCRECKMTPSQKLKKDVGPSIFCRFYQFRKLVFDKELKAAGFSEPKDAKDEDLRLWMPPHNMPSDILKPDDARFLIEYVGDHFCTLVAQEAKAFSLHLGSTTRIAWKSVVAGVREMCDVCETTLFNIHWVCSDCGFVVCIDCYRTRREEESIQTKENRGKSCANGLVLKSEKSENTETTCAAASPAPASASTPPPTPAVRNHARDRDRFDWLFCNSKQPHLQEKLMLTQIVAKTAMWDVWKRLHEVKQKLGCPCSCDNETTVLMLLKKLRTMSENKSLKEKDLNGCNEQVGRMDDAASSPLTILADVAIGSSDSKPEADQALGAGVRQEEEAESALRDLLSNGSCKGETGKVSGGDEEREQQQVSRQEGEAGSKKRSRKPPILSTQLNGVVVSSEAEKGETSLKHFTRRINPIFTSKNTSPRVCSLEETEKLFPDIPHDWWCDGRLLVLKDTGNETPHKHLQLFHQQWLRHQPIVVCKVNEWLEKQLWRPVVFRTKCSDEKIDLIDTETRLVFREQPVRKFWDGFENQKARAKDDSGRTLIYKLKDWPPGEEFGEALPNQFADLMSCIPMPEYTTDSGTRNLVCRLPRSFGLIPDLGPKMYTAYGLASDAMGTTNLHLDMSDAVNVMVYVGSFKSAADEREHRKNVKKALDEAQVELSQTMRARKEQVGALWHIYDARDADKIRDMLNSYALKKGQKLHQHHDPIHDQSFYLDADLRRRLKEEYNVVGYTIVQCLGDAVFIPAGAPHQVRNLHSCIKVAEDFVSPENVAHCFNLTEEFRQLSQAHDNHEDKLQIKNIIYHAIKDSLAAFADDVTAV